MAISNVYSPGRCTWTFNSQDFGIMEAVKCTFSKITHKVMSEAYAAPVDAVCGGWSVVVEGIISERDYDVLNELDGFTKVVGTTTTGTKITVGGPSGDSAATQAELTLVPTVSARSAEAITIHKAVLDNCEPVLGFNPEEPFQKNFLVKFVGIVDGTRSDGDQLFSIGVDGATV